MSSNDDETQVFIVRLWRERREIEGALAEQRGSIEHVSNGERRYFTDLADVLVFMTESLCEHFSLQDLSVVPVPPERAANESLCD